MVFIIGLHGGQLSKSVRAIYGNEFNGEDYLRRFFTRRYQLKRFSVVELCAAIFDSWGIDENKFVFPELAVSEGYVSTKPRTIGIILAQWSVTPREIFSVMDAVRLFINGWEHPDPIEPMALLSIIVQMVRGQELNFVQSEWKDDILVKGVTVDSAGQWVNQKFSINAYLSSLNPVAWNPLAHITSQKPGLDAAKNYLIEWLEKEWLARRNRDVGSVPHQSHIADYIPRIVDLARFIEKPIK